MRSLKATAFLLTLALSACSRGSGEGANPPPPSTSSSTDRDPRCARSDYRGKCTLYQVSIIDLLARPAAYHRKQIRVIGYVEMEFEGSGIYLSGEDWARISRNGIWIDPPSLDLIAPGVFTPQYMIVEGTFDAEETGHMGMWSCAIQDVGRFDSYPLDLQARPKPTES